MGDRTVNVFQTYAVEQKSPFDVEKLADKFRHRNTGWTIPEAYLAVLIHAALADGTLDAEESGSITTIARRSRALSALSPADLAAANNTVNERMKNRPEALKEACQTLPADMVMSVFAHCVEIILSDGQLLRQEAEFLQKLAPLLDIDEANARRIMEVLLIKAQY